LLFLGLTGALYCVNKVGWPFSQLSCDADRAVQGSQN